MRKFKYVSWNVLELKNFKMVDFTMKRSNFKVQLFKVYKLEAFESVKFKIQDGQNMLISKIGI